MIHKDVALAALSALCNADVTSTQKLRAQDGAASAGPGEGPARQQLLVNNLVSSVLAADVTSPVSRNNFVRLQRNLEADGLSAGLGSGLGTGLTGLLSQGLTALSQGFAALSPGLTTLSIGLVEPPSVTGSPSRVIRVSPPTGPSLIINENEFFDPGFDCDFTGLKDTVTYYRGEEVYERPYGWQRFAIKVLDKYSDGNAWLGNQRHRAESVPGEWPVSYHGTSNKGAAGIIQGSYQPGGGQDYGRGIYSTPYIAVANGYVKEFTHKGKKYRVILQNRINPQKRQIHNNGEEWLIPIPAGTSKEEEQQKVQESIRPYGLLVKEI